MEEGRAGVGGSEESMEPSLSLAGVRAASGAAGGAASSATAAVAATTEAAPGETAASAGPELEAAPG